MASKKSFKISFILIFILVLTIGAISGLLFAKWSKNQNLFEKSQSQILAQKSPVATKTYTNLAYGFSFNYPANWEEQVENLAVTNKELIFQVAFQDPEQEKKQELFLCLNSQMNNWNDAKHPQSKCESLIINLTEEEKEKLSQIIYPKNIYVWVMKPATKMPLKDWLEKYYSSQGGELQYFTVGKTIEMADLTGYINDIACCADYNMGYDIQSGDYVYRLGTNYQDADKKGDNELLKEIAKTFKILP